MVDCFSYTSVRGGLRCAVVLLGSWFYEWSYSEIAIAWLFVPGTLAVDVAEYQLASVRAWF